MKQLLVFLFLLCAMSVSAQDVIVKKDGSTILSKVLEVGQEEIKYKKFDNLDGPTYTIQKSELQTINYQNGAKDTFSAPVREENRYLPNNQNDGTQQYNDRALLELDKRTGYQSVLLKKMKFRNALRWTGGSLSATVGVLGIAWGIYRLQENKDYGWLVISAGIGFGGLSAWLFSSAKSHNKLIEQKKEIQSYSLYQFNFPVIHGSSLSLGADLLSDRTLGSNTIGLGLRYNF